MKTSPAWRLARHDGVRFANGAEVTLQELGTGVTGYVNDLLSSFVWRKQAVEAF
jgi:hypothetical protein